MKRDEILEMIEKLGEIKTDLYNKDFLLTWNHSDQDISAVVLTAEILEEMYRSNTSTRLFNGGLAVSIFRDKSTRTRFSYASAASLLGLLHMDLDEAKSQIAHGETVRETANMISFVTESIGIRDDLFVGYGHEYMKEVSESVEQGFKDGVLPQRPCVINLQCDRDHPTQSLSDLIHLKKTFGGLDKLRGKRIAMTWAYSPSYGKPLSVPQGIITLMTRFGMEVVLAHPKGYELLPECIATAKRFAEQSHGKFIITNSMEEAFRDADIVYPKSWGSLNLMKMRTDLLKSGQGHKVEALEKEGLQENALHKDWECTEGMIKLTREGKALYMHCLPADISGVSCEQGEVSSSVFDRYRNATYHQAEHKLYVIAGIILLTRFEKPAEILRELVMRSERLEGKRKISI